MNRCDMMTQFGLSLNQASSDLSRYTGLATHNWDSDRSRRSYVRQPCFRSMFDKLDTGRYLAELRSVADGILDHDDSWIAGRPDYDSRPTAARGVDPATPQSVVDAIRRSEAIEVKYQSLSNAKPRRRWIASHAMAFDGFRSRTRASLTSDVLAQNDQDWYAFATLEIRPHPGLADTQATVIAPDCGMIGGRAQMKVRRASLYYQLRRLVLDTDPAAKKPQGQQIVLVNQCEIPGALN